MTQEEIAKGRNDVFAAIQTISSARGYALDYDNVVLLADAFVKVLSNMGDRAPGRARAYSAAFNLRGILNDKIEKAAIEAKSEWSAKASLDLEGAL